MLHILLLILKIIGILLLCVLGVLVLGIVCALFVPVRYRIEVVRKEGAGEPPVAATVKITWLFHFVNVLVCFTGSLSVRARLMLFTVFRLPKRKKRRGSAKADEPGNGKDREAGKRQKTEKLPTARETESGGTGDSTGDERKNEEIRTAEEAVSSGVTKGDEKGTAQAVDG
ncbi:MAG: hypothetical protein K2M20_13815, partial [Lachnospiraceae bacterium]|nr:hypothetical protein [Lachnospiraceae bacterium]